MESPSRNSNAPDSAIQEPAEFGPRGHPASMARLNEGQETLRVEFPHQSHSNPTLVSVSSLKDQGLFTCVMMLIGSRLPSRKDAKQPMHGTDQ